MSVKPPNLNSEFKKVQVLKQVAVFLGIITLRMISKKDMGKDFGLMFSVKFFRDTLPSIGEYQTDFPCN